MRRKKSPPSSLFFPPVMLFLMSRIPFPVFGRTMECSHGPKKCAYLYINSGMKRRSVVVGPSISPPAYREGVSSSRASSHTGRRAGRPSGIKFKKTKFLSWFLSSLGCRSPGCQKLLRLLQLGRRPRVSWPGPVGCHVDSDFAMFSIMQEGGREGWGQGGVGVHLEGP